MGDNPEGTFRKRTGSVFPDSAHYRGTVQSSEGSQFSWKVGTVIIEKREHSRTFAGAFRTHSRHIRGGIHSRIRTHSRTFAHFRAAFAHVRGFARIRAHSRTFAFRARALQIRSKDGHHSRNANNRFTEIPADIRGRWPDIANSIYADLR